MDEKRESKNHMERGLLIILSGPSGVGKGTIRKYFEQDERLNLAYSTSMTTRKPRAGEVDGRDYYFSSREDFEEAIKNGELLEWAEFVGNYYGTPLKEVNRLRDEGKNVLLEIEVQGALQPHLQYARRQWLSGCCPARSGRLPAHLPGAGSCARRRRAPASVPYLHVRSYISLLFLPLCVKKSRLSGGSVATYHSAVCSAGCSAVSSMTSCAASAARLSLMAFASARMSPASSCTLFTVCMVQSFIRSTAAVVWV